MQGDIARVQSSYGGGPAPPPPRSKTEGLVFRWQDLEVECRGLANVPSELNRVTNEEARVMGQLTGHRQDLSNAERDEAFHTRKLKTAENRPGVLQIFSRGGKKGNIAKNQAGLEADHKREAEDKKIITREEEELRQLNMRHRELDDAERHREKNLDEQDRIRKDVIDMNATPALMGLRDDTSNAFDDLRPVEEDVDWEQRNSDILHGVLRDCERSIQLYNESMMWERQAERDNQVAQVDAFFDGGGAFEEMEQARRDQEMQNAMRPAREASRLMNDVIRKIPREIRERYPDHVRNLGQVQIPMLEGQNFGQDMAADFWGGGFGAEMSDMRAGNKIQRNMRVIRRCQEITQDQFNTARDVSSFIDHELRRYQDEARDLRSRAEGIRAEMEREMEAIWMTHLNAAPPKW
jgi:hypothetical protein